MSRIHLTEQQWAFIQPLLPPPARTGCPRANDRRPIEGNFYILITDCRWQDLPREYGTPTTVWRRLKWWGEEGVWERMWRAALAALDQQGQVDWSMGFLDGSFAPAKKGGDNVGLTKKGKGTKWMLVVDGHGLPLGFHLDSAQVAEFGWPSGPWIPRRSLVREDDRDGAPTNSWQIAGMIVAGFVLPSGVGGSACASHPSAARHAGKPSADAPWWRVKMTIG